MGFRRTTAAAAALILVVEAIGIVGLHIFLSMVVDEQKMSASCSSPPRSFTDGWAR